MEVRKAKEMGSACCGHEVKFDGLTAAYKQALWALITINSTMFLVELGVGIFAGSQAL